MCLFEVVLYISVKTHTENILTVSPKSKKYLVITFTRDATSLKTSSTFSCKMQSFLFFKLRLRPQNCLQDVVYKSKCKTTTWAIFTPGSAC